MARRAREYQAGSAEPFHGPDIEYRLSRVYRRPVVLRFVAAVALTIVCIITPLTILDGAAAIFSALALYFAVMYLWRGRFCTRVTSRGIEVHGYFNHFVPWGQVRDIEVRALPGAGEGPEETMGAAAVTQMGIGLHTISAPNPGPNISRLAGIAVVKADGHKVRLRAPVVSGWAADPDFDDKARQLHELCLRYGRGAIAHPGATA